jgi:SAM-dependent methyltransferase
MALKYEFETHLDDPRTTIQHRNIILSKRFLKRIYIEWYTSFVKETQKNPNGKYLEIGSGGGFLKDLLPNVITSDVLLLPHVEMMFSAEKMPFKEEELDGIFMLNVLHHIPHPYLFFREAERILKPGGKIIMVEPANTPLSKFIYQRFHHEPFLPDAGWKFESSGRLSGSNQAIPYIYMMRDRKKFEKEFISLKIESIEVHTAFRFILSGGFSYKNLVPEWTYGFWKLMEKIPGINSLCGMMGTYIVSKRPHF